MLPVDDRADQDNDNDDEWESDDDGFAQGEKSFIPGGGIKGLYEKSLSKVKDAGRKVCGVLKRPTKRPTKRPGVASQHSRMSSIRSTRHKKHRGNQENVQLAADRTGLGISSTSPPTREQSSRRRSILKVPSHQPTKLTRSSARDHCQSGSSQAVSQSACFDEDLTQNGSEGMDVMEKLAFSTDVPSAQEQCESAVAMFNSEEKEYDFDDGYRAFQDRVEKAAANLNYQSDDTDTDEGEHLQVRPFGSPGSDELDNSPGQRVSKGTTAGTSGLNVPVPSAKKKKKKPVASMPIQNFFNESTPAECTIPDATEFVSELPANDIHIPATALCHRRFEYISSRGNPSFFMAHYVKKTPRTLSHRPRRGLNHDVIAVGLPLPDDDEEVIFAEYRLDSCSMRNGVDKASFYFRCNTAVDEVGLTIQNSVIDTISKNVKERYHGWSMPNEKHYYNALLQRKKNTVRRKRDKTYLVKDDRCKLVPAPLARLRYHAAFEVDDNDRWASYQCEHFLIVVDWLLLEKLPLRSFLRMMADGTFYVCGGWRQLVTIMMGLNTGVSEKMVNVAGIYLLTKEQKHYAAAFTKFFDMVQERFDLVLQYVLLSTDMEPGLYGGIEQAIEKRRIKARTTVCGVHAERAIYKAIKKIIPFKIIPTPVKMTTFFIKHMMFLRPDLIYGSMLFYFITIAKIPRIGERLARFIKDFTLKILRHTWGLRYNYWRTMKLGNCTGIPVFLNTNPAEAQNSSLNHRYRIFHGRAQRKFERDLEIFNGHMNDVGKEVVAGNYYEPWKKYENDERKEDHLRRIMALCDSYQKVPAGEPVPKEFFLQLMSLICNEFMVREESNRWAKPTADFLRRERLLRAMEQSDGLTADTDLIHLSPDEVADLTNELKYAGVDMSEPEVAILTELGMDDVNFDELGQGSAGSNLMDIRDMPALNDDDPADDQLDKVISETSMLTRATGGSDQFASTNPTAPSTSSAENSAALSASSTNQPAGSVVSSNASENCALLDRPEQTSTIASTSAAKSVQTRGRKKDDRQETIDRIFDSEEDSTDSAHANATSSDEDVCFTERAYSKKQPKAGPASVMRESMRVRPVVPMPEASEGPSTRSRAKKPTRRSPSNLLTPPVGKMPRRGCAKQQHVGPNRKHNFKLFKEMGLQAAKDKMLNDARKLREKEPDVNLDDFHAVVDRNRKKTPEMSKETAAKHHKAETTAKKKTAEETLEAELVEKGLFVRSGRKKGSKKQNNDANNDIMDPGPSDQSNSTSNTVKEPSRTKDIQAASMNASANQQPRSRGKKKNASDVLSDENGNFVQASGEALPQPNSLQAASNKTKAKKTPSTRRRKNTKSKDDNADSTSARSMEYSQAKAHKKKNICTEENGEDQPTDKETAKSSEKASKTTAKHVSPKESVADTRQIEQQLANLGLPGYSEKNADDGKTPPPLPTSTDATVINRPKLSSVPTQPSTAENGKATLQASVTSSPSPEQMPPPLTNSTDASIISQQTSSPALLKTSKKSSPESLPRSAGEYTAAMIDEFIGYCATNRLIRPRKKSYIKILRFDISSEDDLRFMFRQNFFGGYVIVPLDSMKSVVLAIVWSHKQDLRLDKTTRCWSPRGKYFLGTVEMFCNFVTRFIHAVRIFGRHKSPVYCDIVHWLDQCHSIRRYPRQWPLSSYPFIGKLPDMDGHTLNITDPITYYYL
ncbi:Oidioi.mRNA.OKI2018_I69.chr2.g5895.t1.cds [Oikopleura dioica]|uniref:Oidioi.mRNA.OKI2018_I69.chr2.g5895.t1.cds n=1 Tax=Oikopleura dioica TaxID=34765 RepID=A0ABN7T2A2_OIKDI|nr:Oidioi.mRNA.OKI2018_I69.chr2.g5895.t1.cds [Oikopleura dioica]